MSLNAGEQMATSASNFQMIIKALGDYTKLTGIDLSRNPFAEKLELLNTPDAVLELLQERESAFQQYRDGNRTLITYLSPAVRVLHAFSETLGEAVSLVPFPPARAVFVGIGVLISAASGVSSSYDALLDLFECLGSFLKRLDIYINIPPSSMMTDIIVKILVELLAVLALATKQITEGRLKKFAKKLLGEGEVEAVLQRLDRLTQDEARITVAQTLTVVHGLVNNMKVVMEDGKVSMDGIRQALVALHQIVHQMNKIQRDPLQRDVQHWLSPPDPSTNHDFVWKAHHQGTAEWFLESNVLSEWKSAGSLLWIHGKPGSGKSTLLSAIIQDIEDMRTAGLAMMAYYYFDFRDIRKQDHYGLVSSLLSQLSAASDSCYEVLSQLYSHNAGGARKPIRGPLIQCLKDMLSLPGQDQIYFIIDALDECPDISGTPSAREEVLNLVEELVGLNLPNVHLCVASRPEIDIRMILDPLTSLQISLHDERGQRDDIIKYINSVVHSDRKMRRWREEDKQLVIDVLSDKADGMFRWVACQIDRLRRNFPASIRSALTDLPESLDETYEHALSNIDKEKQEYAHRLFQCLSVCARPLHTEELADVLAVRLDEETPPTFNPDWRPMDAEEALLSACSSLVTVVSVAGSQVIQFSHFSVKEFLTSERLAAAEERLSYYHILPQPAHVTLSRISLSVLLHLDDKIDKNTIHRFPLAPYAAQHWVDHAQFNGVSSRIQDMMERLFDPMKPHFAIWLWLYDIDRHWLDPMAKIHPMQPEASPLYYASLCGLGVLAEHLVVAQSSDVNNIGGFHMTSLHAASFKGHVDVVMLLLENGAEPDSRDIDGRTPLHRVSQGGHRVFLQSSLDVTRLLLNYGAKINVTDKLGWTPLHTAARNGHREVAELLLGSGASLEVRSTAQETPLALACGDGKLEVARLLIDHGSNINSRDQDGRTPLHKTSRYGHLDVARLLLDRRAEVNVHETNMSTPLHFASAKGHLDIAKLLVQYGASIDCRDDKHRTPLHRASEEGYLETACFLVEHRAVVSPRDDKGWIPFHKASKGGHFQVVKFLFECGVDIDIRTGDEETALGVASTGGELDVVSYLVAQGADVWSRDKTGSTPIHMASKCGHLRVVTFLLERGIDINIRDNNGKTPLDLASSSGKSDVIRFLIERGADIHTRDNEGWNSLHIASQNGHLDVVRPLIDAGVAIDIQNGTKKTPLSLALSKGQVEVSHYLIQQGADPNSRDNLGWSPLHFASRHGHVDMVRLLLGREVDPNCQEYDLWSPLHLASTNGQTKIAQLLLQHGARVDIVNGKQQTPLHQAAAEGKIEIALLLIDHGANVNTADWNMRTPLHAASQSGHLEVLKLLLGRGADINARNNDNQRAAELASVNQKTEVASFLAEYEADPDGQNNLRLITSAAVQDGADENGVIATTISLHSASEEGNVDVVKLLLERGADINAKNTCYLTPLDLAAAKGNVDVVRLLVERGAEVDSRDNFGWTPLHKASRYGHLEVSRVLMDHDANINARKHDYWTPLHLSARDGDIGIVELLLERGADIHVLNDDGQTPYQLSQGFGHRRTADLLQERGRCGT